MNADDEQRSWLTRILLEHPDILHDAVMLAGTREPGDETSLALRQMLDARLRETARWPRQQDYASIAQDLEDAGKPHFAALLREVGADDLLDEAKARWAYRYAGRADTEQDRLLDAVTGEDRIQYSDDGPVRGVDGAWYARGYIENGTDKGHVVAVYGRGLGELIQFGGDHELHQRWVADRGPAAAGELLVPDLAMSSRTVREERILASILGNPAQFPSTMVDLPPDTFTADARYEIYASMVTLADGGRHWYAWQVATEIDRRAALLPADTLLIFGGERVPWLQTYLQRLIQTTVTTADGEAAARSVVEEDARTRQMPGWRTVIAERAARIPVAAPREQPDAGRWLRQRTEHCGEARPPLLRPPPAQSDQHGPVPRM